MPPATVTTSPVTCPAARSEHSQATVRAMSSVRATLRSAIVAVTCSTTASVSDALGHRRDGPARGDDVDARRRELVLERQREPLADRGLRGGVVGVAGLAEAAGGRADQDERARVRRPRPRAKARAVRNVAVRLPSIVARQRSSGSSATGRPRSATRRRWRRRARAGRPARTARRPAPRRAGRRRARRRRAPPRAPRAASRLRW